MDFKKIVSLTIILFLFSCCTTPEDTCDFNRRFDIHSKIFPYLDEYKIGDTISFSLEIPQDIYDNTKNENVDIRDWEFATNLTIYRLEEVSLIHSNHKFEYSKTKGEFGITILETDVWSINFVPEINDSIRVFELNIIPQDTGTFVFQLWHFIQYLTLRECPHRRVLLSYILNNNIDKNYDLIDIDIIERDIGIDVFEKNSGFVFNVIE